MRCTPGVLFLLSLSQALAPAAMAQSADPSSTEVALCDPYLTSGDDNDDSGNEEEADAERRVRYDLEKSEILTSEEAVMDAVYEEKWDLATGTPVARQALCQGQETYVVHWAEIMGQDDQGEVAVVARGLFRMMKDGTFQFDYAKRPYSGHWQFTDGKMVLEAGWLNGGAPLASDVERVETPVELTAADGGTDSYTEEVYRIGPFRLLPIDTTARGTVQDCACPVN